jgi:hypothetical protein
MKLTNTDMSLPDRRFIYSFNLEVLRFTYILIIMHAVNI